jgi:phage baseplate assembly protein W
MFMTDTNDLLCVRGVDLARQSVIREIPVPSGTIPNRAWGCGVNTMIAKGVTTATIDRIKNVIRRRMLLNPRIKVVQFVDVSRSENGVVVNVGLLTVNGAIQARVEL